MSKRTRRPGRNSNTKLDFQKLEPKRCLASVGWDGPGQGSAELTYHIGDAPSSVGQAQFESAIEKALEVWAEVADINFTVVQTPGLNDSLDISFAAIDGQGGTLAQAYFPDDVNPNRIAGDIQFDLAENWEVGNAQGGSAFDLVQVAVHEVGHALGLAHDHSSGSVLNATVSPFEQFTELGESDVREIQELYAPAAPTEETPGNVDPGQPDPTPETDTDDTEETDTQDDNEDRTDRWNKRHRRSWRFNFWSHGRRFRVFFSSDSFRDDGLSENDNTEVDTSERGSNRFSLNRSFRFVSFWR